MGYGMRWFLKEQILKEERYGIYILAGSVGYAVNGYTLLYYGMGWLDVAAILPLLCYFFCRMAEREGDWRLGKNTLGYIVCLTLVFLINIPQAYTMCFFLIVLRGDIFFLNRQDQPLKKNSILKFGLTSLPSLGIAAVIFLPAARAMLGSYRLSGEEYRGISGYFLLLRQDGMDAVWEMGDSWQRGGSAAVLRHFWQTEAGAHLAVVSGGGDGAAGFLRGGQSHLAPRDVCVLPDAIWLYAGVCRDLYGSGARAGFCGGEPHAAEHFICVPWNLVRADGGARHRFDTAGAAHGRGGFCRGCHGNRSAACRENRYFPQGKAGGRSD